ncbi:unnamed protein product [Tetraodon nigroviridis]|uniref:Chromosome 11 SCAF14979, whole genome shotgun sequence n=1 Tax=Tetraodon nigroviridis TaxID=99883 RepID=Q4RXE6_TETNG|nr:unnamed protein product [Tetraodon nigroviridis]
MAEEAEPRTEAQPDEELEADLPPAGGVVQTPDLTEACDKELKTKPADSEESQRRGGIEEVAEMLPQSDHEHRGAESSGSGTEETLKTTQWLVSTGPDEKESELTCEGETVTSEPPESFWSGSPPEVQNLNTSHPEPDDDDASGADEPPNATVGQDREADGQVDDVKRRSDQLLQEHKDLPSEIEQSCSSQALQPEEGSCLDPQPQQSDACFTLTEHKRKLGSSRRHKGGRRPVELLTASTEMMTVASDDVQDHQPAQKMSPVVSEEKYVQEDTDLSPDKEENNTETTSSESDIWRPTHHSCATTGFVTSEALSLDAPHVALKDQDSPSEGSVEGQQKPVQVCDTVTDEGAQATSPSEPTNAELTSSDPSSSLCFQKTVSADSAMEVAGEHEPGSHLDDSLHFQQRSKQRRRKMGSTRWTNKSPEVRRAAVTENSDSAQASQEGVERPAEESGETNTEIPVKLPQDEANVTFDPQNTQSNLIARPEGVNPTILVDGSGLWGGNSREPSQLGAPPPSFQSTQDDQESPPGKQEQPLQSAEESAVGLEKERSQLEADEEHKDPEDPDKVAEGGYVKNLEPENAGPDLDTANGRRMMGSTCRSPTSLRKEEDLHHQQKVDDETADEQRGEGSSERRKEPVKDTHLLEPPPLQTSEEASTTSESDHQPTTSPENDVMSDTFSSKRRRKLGSHRKSSRPQNHKTQTGSAAEHTLKIDEEDKISEVRSVFSRRGHLYQALLHFFCFFFNFPLFLFSKKKKRLK